MSSAEYSLEQNNTSKVKHCELSPEEKRAWLFYRNKAYALWRGNVEREKVWASKQEEYEKERQESHAMVADLRILIEEQEREMNELIRRIEAMKR